MALLTGGTDATDSLNALLWNPGPGSGISAANFALVNAGILNDQNVAHPVWPAALSNAGVLSIPNRGVLKVLPGDYVMFDTDTGWPILVSANAIANGPWTHS